jgi:hypothetical protein
MKVDNSLIYVILFGICLILTLNVEENPSYTWKLIVIIYLVASSVVYLIDLFRRK